MNWEHIRKVLINLITLILREERTYEEESSLFNHLVLSYYISQYSTIILVFTKHPLSIYTLNTDYPLITNRSLLIILTSSNLPCWNPSFTIHFSLHELAFTPMRHPRNFFSLLNWKPKSIAAYKTGKLWGQKIKGLGCYDGADILHGPRLQWDIPTPSTLMIIMHPGGPTAKLIEIHIHEMMWDGTSCPTLV